MADRVIITAEPDRLSVRRTAWSAVFAGALVALMTTFLLSLLAAGIGLQNVDPASEQNTFAGFGTGGLVALIATNLIALFLGGWVTGYLAGLPRRGDALMHGVLTWAVLTVLTIVLLTTAVGRFIGGAASLVGGTLSSLTQGAATAAPDSSQGAADALAQLPGAGALQRQVDGFLEQAGVQNPEQAGQELAQLVGGRLQAELGGHDRVQPGDGGDVGVGHLAGGGGGGGAGHRILSRRADITGCSRPSAPARSTAYISAPSTMP